MKPQHKGHTYYEIYFHLVWSTKKRIPMLNDEIEKKVKEYIKSKCKDMEIELLEINGTEDHLHLLVSMKPTHCPANVIHKLKGSSSHFINNKYLPQNSLHSLYWQPGYGILSLGKKSIPKIIKYIRNQKEHHRNKTTIDKLEEC